MNSSIAPRILIVRLSAVGDVIHGLPVANALRAKFPQAFIGWVVEGRAADLLEGHAALDEVIRVPRGWLKSACKVLAVRRKLKPLKFDIAVDLQSLTKSSLAAWLSGAKRRLGVAGRDGREISKWFNNELTTIDATHVIEHYLQILRPLGIENPQVEFKLPERAAEGRFADEFLAAAGLPAQRFALLNPGAGWPSKIWPYERYAQLAQRLGQTRGVRSLVVWGGEQERQMAAEIVALCPEFTTLAPSTTIPELAALARRARLFVGSDTGPMHLAVAVDTPTISLHGTSRAAWTGAYGPYNIRLQAWYQDGSSHERRAASNDAMQAITVDDVAAACDTLLDRATQQQASMRVA